jgi:hypothetical protein
MGEREEVIERQQQELAQLHHQQFLARGEVGVQGLGAM